MNKFTPLAVTDVEVKIVPRRSAEGHPFSDLLYSFTENGVRRTASTRRGYVVTDSPYGRAQEVEAFKKRRAVFHEGLC